MEGKGGGTRPEAEDERRAPSGAAERDAEIKNQANLAPHDGTFRASRQDKRTPSLPEKDASFHEEEEEEELSPPDGGWGWMVALGAFIITVSEWSCQQVASLASLGILAFL